MHVVPTQTQCGSLRQKALQCVHALTSFILSKESMMYSLHHMCLPAWCRPRRWSAKRGCARELSPS